MVTVSGATLRQMREVQGVTGPNMCLAASKFLVLKVLGVIDPHRHLSDFLRSPWAAKNSALPLANYWGWTMSLYNDDFNRKVLPALNDATANVRSSSVGKVEVRYEYFRNDAARADSLLKSGVPLVVAVGVDGRGQDHHIAVVPATDGIWAVDPWPGPPSEAVKALPQRFTFTRVHVIDLALKKLNVPCGVPVIGYYRDADYESHHVFKVNDGCQPAPTVAGEEPHGRDMYYATSTVCGTTACISESDEQSFDRLGAVRSPLP